MRSFFITLAILLVPGVAIAGRMGGPVTHVDVVKRDATDSYVMIFEGLSSGRITVRGDGSSDLDCSLWENGHQVLADNDNTDTCFLSWFQVSSGKVTLKIKNFGAPNMYRVETN